MLQADTHETRIFYFPQRQTVSESYPEEHLVDANGNLVYVRWAPKQPAPQSSFINIGIEINLHRRAPYRSRKVGMLLLPESSLCFPVCEYESISDIPF